MTIRGGRDGLQIRVKKKLQILLAGSKLDGAVSAIAGLVRATLAAPSFALKQKIFLKKHNTFLLSYHIAQDSRRNGKFINAQLNINQYEMQNINILHKKLVPFPNFS
jgi:hypothetical protein